MIKRTGSRLGGRMVRTIGVVAAAAGLSACSVGSLFGGGSSASTTGSLANSSPSQTEIAAAAQDALPAIATECPPIKVRPGAEALFSFAKKRVGDPEALKFQAVIDKQSRNCVVSNGLITVNMGVVGRVLMGPDGQTPFTYDVPLRFAVERNKMAVFSELYKIPVTVNADKQSADFVKVVDNVAIPYIGGENIVIWVGFDSATKKKG